MALHGLDDIPPEGGRPAARLPFLKHGGAHWLGLLVGTEFALTKQRAEQRAPSYIHTLSLGYPHRHRVGGGICF